MGYSASFYLISFGSNFVSSLFVEWLAAQGTGDWTNKMILSGAYAIGRVIYNFGMSYSTTASAACGCDKGLMGFILEIGLTGLLFWGVAWAIGYQITWWYALLVSMATAPFSDGVDGAIKTSFPSTALAN